MPNHFLQLISGWNPHSAIRITQSEICMQLSIFVFNVNNFRVLARSVPKATNLWKKMLADFYFTGYIATNIVKDSTKSVQPSVFSLPLSTGWCSAWSWVLHEGVVLEDASFLSLFLMKLSGFTKRKLAVSCTGIVEGRADLRSRE